MSCVVIAGMFTGCTSDKNSMENGEQSSQPTSSTMTTVEKTAKEGEKTVLTLFFADSQGSKLVAEKRFIQKTAAKNVNEAAQIAMKELFKGPISGTLTSPFPKDVKSPTVKVNKNIATVDLSKDFVQKHPGGSSGESLTIFAIVNTLTTVEGVNEVSFTIDGKKATEFKGHLDISKPFKKNPEIMSKETQPQQSQQPQTQNQQPQQTQQPQQNQQNNKTE
jgi:spore germination protein GerM